jgi:DNA-binding MarR family transcriptional regulator
MKRLDLAVIAQDIERDLRAIREIIRRPLEAEVARGNLTGPQQSVLRALVLSEGMSLKELSAQLGLAHSTVSGIVDRLQKRGLVERRADESDRRVTRIAVTQPVRVFVRETLPKLTIHPLVEALGRADVEQRRAIVKGLKTLRKMLEMLERQTSLRRKENDHALLNRNFVRTRRG